MSAANALTGEAQKPGTDAAPHDSSQHWSLAPSTWPGAKTSAPYPARAWRTRARLQVLQAWQARLQRLSHHDPEFTYDPGHEYEEDWTTDADYRQDGVRLYQYNGDGHLIMPHGSFHSRFLDLVLQTLCLVLGRRVCREPDLHYPAWLGEELGQLTESGEPRTRRSPDLAVMPESWTLSEERERTVDERIIRLDEGDPAPELVLEVVSRSNEGKDFHDNMSLYANLGIPEYVIADTGEFSDTPHMWLFRLDSSTNSYRMAENGRSVTACDTPMRLLDAPVAGNVPVFQCRDPNGQWHDHEGDIALRERSAERVDIHAQLLDIHFPHLAPSDRASLVDAWTRNGVPGNMLQRIADAAANPNRRRAILGLKQETQEAGDAGPAGGGG